MKPYYQDNRVTQYCGDALNVLPELPTESIDLLVTDPPYGIGFMGKDWDKALPDKAIWQECFRVLKDGAFAFVMSIPRADCLSRMIISLEDAGFMVNFTPIFWAYASGFPKAQNISLAIDKQECRRRLSEELGRKPTKEEFSEAWHEFREVVDKYQYPDKCNRNVIDSAEFSVAYGKNRSGGSHDITEPSTPEAKALDGSYGGFQPKPAVEVIIVAMKPLSEKTFVDQALKNRKGIIWLDEGRIPYESEGDKQEGICERQSKRISPFTPLNTEKDEFDRSNRQHLIGRFPANLLVSDNVLNDGRIIKGDKPSVKSGDMGYHGTKQKPFIEYQLTDSGSFSRYFDLGKWAQKTFPFLIVPKASKSEKNKHLDMKGYQHQTGSRTYDNVCANCGKKLVGDLPFRCTCTHKVTQKRITKGNFHPTVKPLKLMSYLITLGSREGDTILDPFMGSATTCLAAKLLGRKAIGIEIEERYCEIAAKRCLQEVMELV